MNYAMHLKQLGPYDLDKPIGKGGMGTVYRAFHRDTGELAAVKALAPGLAATEGFRDRFEGEIESLKRLRHPGIVRLLGYGEEDGLLFYAMELVEGTSLEEELRAGRRFTWREVTDIGIQICRALKHAHDHGVVHRDIKPANVLIDAEGRIKIADFGIARLFGSTQLTSAGGVLGTADYMPPEQIDGRNVTERCDQYSLGGVMYALLAGRPPFRAKSLPEMLQLQRFAEPEPVRRFAPDAPEQLEQLIMQLLSKDPADRFPNTLVLARHMEAMRRALSRPAPDDFALSAESPDPPARPDPSYEAVGMDTTRIEPGSLELAASKLVEGLAGGSVESKAELKSDDQDVPALAGTGGAASAAKGTVRGWDVTGPLLGDASDGDDLKLEPPVERFGRDAAPAAARAEVRPASRFRTVEDELRETPPADFPSRVLLVAQVLALLGSIAILGAGIWYFSRPAQADELYAQIDEQAAEGRAEALRTVEPQIEEFLQRFPDDPRAREVAGYQEEIALSRLESRLHQRARRRLGGQSLAPIEQLYLDAIRKADSDPTEAIRDLQAILVLYHDLGPAVREGADAAAAEADSPRPPGDPTSAIAGSIQQSIASPTPQADAEAPTSRGGGTDVVDADDAHAEVDPDEREYNRRVEQCLKLIKRRLAQLSRYTAMEAANQLPVFQRRLAAAHALRDKEPYQARGLYEAIIRLGEGKQWARGVVSEAAAALQAMGAPAPAAAP
jgi:serine/threonine-protein kinase